MKYFLHDTSAFSDEKITMLHMKFGFEAVGLFYTILEKLALQEKPIQETVLRAQLGIRKKLEKQLYFMYEIEILSVKNGEVFNENILKFSEKYQIKKEKTKKRVSEWREKQADAKSVTRYESVRNADKVNKSKVKESKVNTNIVDGVVVASQTPTKTMAEKKEERVSIFKSQLWDKIQGSDNSLFWTGNDYQQAKKFLDYWCESSPTQRKVRFEKEKSFDIARRMRTWEERGQQQQANNGQRLTQQQKNDISKQNAIIAMQQLANKPEPDPDGLF